MKVSFDQQIFFMQQYGGISRYYTSLAKALNTLDCEARIECPLYRNAYLEPLPEGIHHGYKIPQALGKHWKKLRRLNNKLAARSIQKWPADIVHQTFYSKENQLHGNKPIIVTVYDMIDELFPRADGSTDPVSERKRRAVERADHVICISENTQKDLIETFGTAEEKTSVTYLANDPLPTPSIQKNPQLSKRPYLLYVGARPGYKNFTGLLKAFANSEELTTQFDLVAFGGQPFSTEENAMIHQLGIHKQVHQIGGDDHDLARAYTDAHLFIYPSMYEGFGIPPLEAMSMSCPVATSNTSCIPEVVGNAAEFFDPNSSESIRTALENLSRNTARKDELIQLGHSRLKNFSWKKCAEETLAVYRSLA